MGSMVLVRKNRVISRDETQRLTNIVREAGTDENLVRASLAVALIYVDLKPTCDVRWFHPNVQVLSDATIPIRGCGAQVGLEETSNDPYLKGIVSWRGRSY